MACTSFYKIYLWKLQTDNNNHLHFVIKKVQEETTHLGMTSSMVIKKTKRDDSALFQCLATNKFGNSQKTIKLIVQVYPSLY